MPLRYGMIGLGGCVLIMASLSASALESHAIHDQLRTFERILSVTLEHAGLQNGEHWTVGKSPFDAEIDSSYIPTVGAIIEIPVEFPIVQRATETPEAERPALDPNEDLWERFSRDRRRGPSDDAPQAVPRDAPQPEDGPSAPPKTAPQAEAEARAHLEREMERTRVELRDSHVIALDRDNFAPRVYLFGDAGLRYDAEKVEKLRSAVIGTLAKYGHRLDAIPADERILIIVEAPRSERRREGKGDAGDKSAAEIALRGVLGETQLRVFQDGAPDGRGNSRDSRPYFAGFRTGEAKDRLLFSVTKSALTAEMTADALKPVLEEVQY